MTNRQECFAALRVAFVTSLGRRPFLPNNLVTAKRTAAGDLRQDDSLELDDATDFLGWRKCARGGVQAAFVLA